MVRNLLNGDPAAPEKEARIKLEFCRLLQEARPKFPGDFSPIPGAFEFIDRLRAERICAVAIATGCFDTTARFKLACCGIALDQFPHATSSDACRRRGIISLAVSRAAFDLSSVIYFGDAPWDVRASARHEQLRSLGVRHTFRDYTDATRIIDAISDKGT